MKARRVPITRSIALESASPHLAALLERLSTHYRLAVVSNGSARAQRGKLARLGIDSYFEPTLRRRR
jgi:FMN phosphatase YigB (HAD superfamily)